MDEEADDVTDEPINPRDEIERGEALDVLLDATAFFIRRYVALTDEQRDAIALWVAHVYALDACSTTPYLHVTSAIEESGKTRLLETLEVLTPRAMFASSLTSAVLYRMVDERQPALLIDEIDNTLKRKADENSDLYAVINAGYRRGAVVYRMGGRQMTELQSFSSFCAKALAGIGNLQATLASRCLRVQLDRRDPSQVIEDFYRDDAEVEATAIRDGFSAWASDDVIERLKAARPRKLGAKDRQEESLRLLLAISQEAGEEWNERGRVALRALALSSSEDAKSTAAQLLEDIREVMGEQHHVPTTALLDGLFLIESSPWREWWAERDRNGAFVPSRGAPSQLARKLKPFGIRPRAIRVDAYTTPRGYRREDFVAIWERYLPPHGEAATPATPATSQVPSQADVADVALVAGTAWRDDHAAFSGRLAEALRNGDASLLTDDELKSLPPELRARL